MPDSMQNTICVSCRLLLINYTRLMFVKKLMYRGCEIFGVKVVCIAHETFMLLKNLFK